MFLPNTLDFISRVSQASDPKLNGHPSVFNYLPNVTLHTSFKRGSKDKTSQEQPKSSSGDQHAQDRDFWRTYHQVRSNLYPPIPDYFHRSCSKKTQNHTWRQTLAAAPNAASCGGASSRSTPSSACFLGEPKYTEKFRLLGMPQKLYAHKASQK